MKHSSWHAVREVAFDEIIIIRFFDITQKVLASVQRDAVYIYLFIYLWFRTILFSSPFCISQANKNIFIIISMQLLFVYSVTLRSPILFIL
jgi:hypothetical protein